MKDDYQWLIDLGFEEDDVTGRLNVYNEKVYEFAFDEGMRSIYNRSFKVFLEHGFDQEYTLLCLFFTHTDAFSLSEDMLIKLTDLPKDEIDFITKTVRGDRDE